MLFYPFCKSLLIQIFNLHLFNVITDNTWFRFVICLFAFYRSCNSFVPSFLYHCLLLFLLIQSITTKQRWDLKACSVISGACKEPSRAMWPSRFPGVCSSFSKHPIDISFPRFSIYIFWSTFCWLQLCHCLGQLWY